VFLFLNNKINIAHFHARRLVGHALELDARIVLHALFNVHLQDFPFRLGLRGIALPTALIARALHLR